MTDRELKKLGRGDLLTLLLEQSTVLENTRNELKAAQDKVKEYDETFERLRARLNEKDEKIQEAEETYARLKAKLDAKDAEIASLSAGVPRVSTVDAGVVTATVSAVDLSIFKSQAVESATKVLYDMFTELLKTSGEKLLASKLEVAFVPVEDTSISTEGVTTAETTPRELDTETSH